MKLELLEVEFIQLTVIIRTIPIWYGVFTDCPQVQVTHPYEAQQPDELNLDTGDVVNILRKTPDGMLSIIQTKIQIEKL